MKQIAQFEKVSLEQYKKDMRDCFRNKYTDEEIEIFYNKIELPKRATKGSAGYDFRIPFNLELEKYETAKIPTGIRVRIDEGWVLKLYPRSGLGFKHGFKLINTVGIIDSDYYNSDNEGHIMAKVLYEKGNDFLTIEKAAFVQGIFVEYGVTIDDNVATERNGGFGSTGK